LRGGAPRNRAHDSGPARHRPAREVRPKRPRRLPRSGSEDPHRLDAALTRIASVRADERPAGQRHRCLRRR
jgi:hypothetical protein